MQKMENKNVENLKISRKRQKKTDLGKNSKTKIINSLKSEKIKSQYFD